MGKSRSRSRSGDRGRSGDFIDDNEDQGRAKRGSSPNHEHNSQADPEQDHGRRERRSRSQDRQRDHSQQDGQMQYRGCGRSKSRDRDRSRDRRREWSKERGPDRNPERDRDRSRRTDRERNGDFQRRHDAYSSGQAGVHDSDRGRDRFTERNRGREFDRRTEHPRDRDADKDHRHSRSPIRRWGRDGSRDLKRRSPSRSCSPERGRRRWGSPPRGADGAAARPGEDSTYRRWRSRSPPAAGRGGGAAYSNLPPPPPLQGSRPQPPLPTAPISLAPPPVGSIHRGTVHTIRPFGIFVALSGFRRHVLVHNTQVSDELRFTREDDEDAKVKALEFYFPQREKVWVKITEVAPDERNPAEMRINGSLCAVDQTTGTDLDSEGANGGGASKGKGGPETDEPPEVGSVHRAVVKRIEAYGVFVALEGYRRHGLVHTSQVSNYLTFTRDNSDEERKAELASVVALGEQVWVKVVEVGHDEVRGGYKIGCSIKLVSQANGEDLDPANARYRPRDAPGKGGPGAIGAHAGEVGKGGKIDWGHLAADTKLYVDEKAASKYKLLEEEPPQPPQPPPQQQTAPGIPGLGVAPARDAQVLSPLASGPTGRGRGMVLPAWMTQGRGGGGGGGGPPAPGSLPAPPPHPPNQLPPSSKFELVGGRDRDVDPKSLLLDLVGSGAGSGGGGPDAPRISSIEEALAILEAHGGSRSKKDKKDNKKKEDKHKSRSKERSKAGKKRRDVE